MSIFDGLVFCVTGRMVSGTRREVTDSIEEEGGVVKSGITKATTHLLCSADSLDGPTSKVKKARSNGLFILEENFVIDSIDEGELQDEGKYLHEPVYDGKKKTKKRKAKKNQDRKKMKRKRKVEEEEEEMEDEPPKKRQKTMKKKGGLPAPHERSKHEDDGIIFSEDNDIYNVILNQTNIGRNNNKYYEIQLIKSGDGYHVFTHWGRVGENGQCSTKDFDDLEKAKKFFGQKFRAKTGNSWDNRDDFVEKDKKYKMVEVSYDEDEDETKMEVDEPEEESSGSPAPECELDSRVQDFLQRITNKKMYDKQLEEMKIDTVKMPLGKLSKSQVMKGFEVLKKIEKLVEKNDVGEELEDLCNDFYTYIPTVGKGRQRLPLIDTIDKIRIKKEVLEQLAEMQIAWEIIGDSESDRKVHPLTAAYNRLNTVLTPLDRSDMEFDLVEKYVMKTHGPTHKDYSLRVKDVFKVERKGEREIFLSNYGDMGNKMMLWHGSRMSNFLGILSEGLRIAPPCAPGVYFADMVSKSANYCHAYMSEDVGCALLSEVALGNQLKLGQSDYRLSQKNLEKRGFDSTWGLGRQYVPDSKSHVNLGGIKWPIGDAVVPEGVQSDLLYNEYIVYDQSQCNVKYAVIMDFKYKRGR